MIGRSRRSVIETWRCPTCGYTVTFRSVVGEMTPRCTRCESRVVMVLIS